MLRIIILVLALTAGGVTAWLAINMRPEPTVQTVIQPAPPAPMQDVLVASVNLGEGQVLTRDNMRWQAWPESSLNGAFITRKSRADAPDKLAGAVIRSSMAAAEPIRDEKLVTATGGFLAAILPSGKRAVAVRISAENTAGGFILPRDRVDVLHTTGVTAQAGPADTKVERVSRTLLRNVRVLAIDQSVEQNASEEKSRGKVAAVGKTATLELDPAQAEALAAAESSGTLSLALRSSADNAEASTLNQPPASSNNTVRIVRGGRIEMLHTR